MAFTTTVTKLKSKRNATMSDTIGSVFARNFSFTIPAGAANDSANLGIGLPAGALFVGGWLKANAAVGSAGCVITMKSTTANTVFATWANAATLATTYAALASNTVVPAPANDDTISVAVATANQANAVTITGTLLFSSAGQDDAPYSTYTT